MGLELSGKLIKKLPVQTGIGKNGTWFKQDFVIETKEQYPKKICVTAWGDLTDSIENAGIGSDLNVSINLESREYNDRWYTEVKAWKISAKNSEQKSKEQTHDIPLTPTEDVDDIPW